MKKLLTLPAVVILVVLIGGADFRQPTASKTAEPVAQKPCYGFRILEYGKGIDCHGDTVRLTKVNGVQVLADV